MAKQVGPVNIKVGVNAAGAYAELGKLEGRMKKTAAVAKQTSAASRLAASPIGVGGKAFGGGLLSAIPGVSTALGGPAMIGTAIAASLVAATTAASAHIDAQAKLADRLAISTEALEGLTHAADLSGISNQQLATGLSQLQKNLGKAALGEQMQIEALAQLGLTYQEIAALSLEQQFGLIADRLNDVQDTAIRAAISTELFGKAGQQLAPLLASGSKGIEDMQKEAEKLGLTFSREEAANVEQMNDNWSRFQKSLSGFANQLTISLAPALAEVFDAMTEATVAMSALVQMARAFSGTPLTGTTQQVSMILRGLSLFDRTGVLARMADALGAIRPASASSQIGGTAQASVRLEAAITRGFQGLGQSLESQIAQMSGQSLEQQLGQIQGQTRTQIQAMEAQTLQALQQAQQAINMANATLPAGVAANLSNQILNAATRTIQTMQKNALSLQFQADLEERRVRNLNAQLQLLRQRNAMEQEAARIAQQFISPLAAFQTRLGQIQQLTARGLLSGNLSSLAPAGAFRQLADSLPQASATGPEALQQGSIAAQAAINRFNRQGGAVSLQEQIRNVLRQTQQIEQQQLNEAREVRRILQGLGVVAPAGLGP